MGRTDGSTGSMSTQRKHSTVDPGDRRKVLAGLAAAAVAIPACSSKQGAVPVSGDPVEFQLAGGGPGPGESILPELTPKVQMRAAVAAEEHVAYAPSVPAAVDRSDQRVFEVELEVVESICPLDPANDVATEMWGYRVAGDTDVTCGAPGPVLRGRVGDVARITLTNPASSNHAHNIDFHAVTGQGGGAEGLTVGPGESATVEVRLLYPGVFMYHCAFAPVVEHIARGMVGMFIVDPETPLPPVDHEWSIMQSEWYVGEPGPDGVAAFDPEALRSEEPRYLTFNGRTDALVDDNALRMNVGERARIYLVNEGLNLNSNFHPIGSHWDVVYPEGATHPVNGALRGSQSTLVVAGGGTVTELLGLVPSTIVLVDHALSRVFLKGLIGHVVVEGDADPEIFEGDSSGAGLREDEEIPVLPDDQVLITEGAFDPANDKRAYTPRTATVPVGTTVTWTNEDAVLHTVTSGTSDGTSGSPDGLFDSGDMATGDTFEHTFDSAGTYDYYCAPHPWMRGTVVVE